MPKYFWQVKLSGDWDNYNREENAILVRAYLSGAHKASYSLRGQSYEYHFDEMEQVNIESGRRRPIRPPYGLKKSRPAKPLAQGPTTMVIVPAGAGPGTVLNIPHPQDRNVTLQVTVPAGATPGATLLVPVPPLPEPVPTAPATPAAPPVIPQPLPAPAPAAPAPQTPVNPTTHEKTDNPPPAAKGLTGNQCAAIGGVGVGMAAVGAGGVLLGQAAADGALDGVGLALADAAVEAGDALGIAGEFVMNLF